MALIANNEQDLLTVLNKCMNGVKNENLKVNIIKTKVVHFRRGLSVSRSNYQFICGDNVIETINKYKYLALTFTKFLDYTEMAKSASKAASRSLGLIIVDKEVVWPNVAEVLYHYAWKLVGVRVCLRKKEYVLCVMLTQLKMNTMQ